MCLMDEDGQIVGQFARALMRSEMEVEIFEQLWIGLAAFRGIRIVIVNEDVLRR
jgi:hypothetical protein